ncbi:MAG: hypothetical protein WBW84_12305 [Acidobacteriaceae bacterium]
MKKTPTERQQHFDEQAKTVVEFAESVETPFADLQSYPGESAMMKNYLSVTSIIRRMRMAEAAGLAPPQGPERKAFKKLRAQLAEKSLGLLNATTPERVTRRIREGTI